MCNKSVQNYLIWNYQTEQVCFEERETACTYCVYQHTFIIIIEEKKRVDAWVSLLHVFQNFSLFWMEGERTSPCFGKPDQSLSYTTKTCL